MPNLTTNYELKKPLLTEDVDIEVINENFDKIDEVMFSSAKRTTENIEFDISTQEGFDEAMTFLSQISINDFEISMIGAYNGESVLEIKGISGKGSIIIHGNHTFGGIDIYQVKQESVTFFISTLTIAQKSQYGVKIKDSSNISLNYITIALAEENDVNWELLHVENSIVSIYAPTFNGAYTGASAPTHLVNVSKNSIVTIGSGYTVSSNAGAGAVIGRSMIYVDKTSFYNLSKTPTFTNWAANYAFQIEMVNYPETAFNILYNIETGLALVKTIFANIESVNCYLKSVGINNDVFGLVLSNIDGTGTIDIDSVVLKSGCIISKCNCTVIIDDIDVLDQSVDGQYTLKIVDCKDVKLTTQTVLDCGSRDYEAILIDNSKAWIEDLRYINTPTTPSTNYIDIKNNSNVYCQRIISGFESMVMPDSVFISVDSGSKISIKDWQQGHVDTINFKFKSIDNGACAIGYVSGTGYVLACNTADLTISTKP